MNQAAVRTAFFIDDDHDDSDDDDEDQDDDAHCGSVTERTTVGSATLLMMPLMALTQIDKEEYC